MTTTDIRPYDEACLLVAIQESAKAVENGNMPFGACIADADGTIIAKAHNGCAIQTKRGGSGDVTRHAEVELIRTMGDDIPNKEECTLYASTEPCVMCAGAIYWSGVGRVVYGAPAIALEQVSGPGGFDVPIEQLYDLGRPGTRKIEVVGPLLEEEAMKVHKESGIWKGSNGNQANADIDLERSLFTSGIGAAAASNDFSVPVIDMSKGTDEEIAEELWNAATTVGFFSVVNHGIPQEDIDQAFHVSKEFFSLSQEEKQLASPFARNLNAGYEFMSQVRPSTGTADQKESLQITAREGVMDDRWPSNPSNFRSTAETLLDKCYALSKRIMNLLESKACPNLTPGTLSAAHK
jgi:tRNA(Arg) A34 adenosine deaminase TadA